MKILIKILLLFSSISLKGQTTSDYFRYTDQKGNKYIYDLKKIAIPNKLDTTFLKSEIIIKNFTEFENKHKISYDIWSIKKNQITGWYKLTMGVYVHTPTEQLDTFGGLTVLFKIKKVGESYRIIKIRNLSGFI